MTDPKSIGEAADNVVRQIAGRRGIDWSFDRPGDNFCPSCHHGMGNSPYCCWCGWPDPKLARQRTRNAMAYKDERKEPPEMVSISKEKLIGLLRAAGLLDGLSEREIGPYVENYLTQMG